MFGGVREKVKAAHHKFSLVTACSLNVLIVFAIECCKCYQKQADKSKAICLANLDRLNY